MEDEAIVSLYWQRSESAIRETEVKYDRYLTKIAWNILADREDSRESVNDTYLAAWDAIPPQKPGKLSAFLGRITRNLALNRREKYRAEKRGGGEYPLALQELGDCVPDRAGDPCDRLHLSQVLNRFLASLQPKARHIFLRRYWLFCSIREIAEFYALSESSVKMSLLRSREALRKALEKEEICL